jgi:hypothetical protein
MDQKTLETTLSLACEWAHDHEQLILLHGAPLGSQHLADARLAGVKNPSRIRVLIVDRIPLPSNAQLAEVAREKQILTTASRGCAFGYGMIIRADSWGDRELLLHQLVHVAQYERTHNLAACIREYVCERANSPEFTTGPLEEEARRIAREICAR